MQSIRLTNQATNVISINPCVLQGPFKGHFSLVRSRFVRVFTEVGRARIAVSSLEERWR